MNRALSSRSGREVINSWPAPLLSRAWVHLHPWYTCIKLLMIIFSKKLCSLVMRSLCSKPHINTLCESLNCVFGCNRRRFGHHDPWKAYCWFDSVREHLGCQYSLSSVVCREIDRHEWSVSREFTRCTVKYPCSSLGFYIIFLGKSFSFKSGLVWNLEIWVRLATDICTWYFGRTICIQFVFGGFWWVARVIAEISLYEQCVVFLANNVPVLGAQR